MCSMRARVAGVLTSAMKERRSSWVSYDDIEWQSDDFLGLGHDFERESGLVQVGSIARARAKLFPLRAAVDYAVDWMNRNRV